MPELSAVPPVMSLSRVLDGQLSMFRTVERQNGLRRFLSAMMHVNVKKSEVERSSSQRAEPPLQAKVQRWDRVGRGPASCGQPPRLRLVMLLRRYRRCVMTSRIEPTRRHPPECVLLRRKSWLRASRADEKSGSAAAIAVMAGSGPVRVLVCNVLELQRWCCVRN